MKKITTLFLAFLLFTGKASIAQIAINTSGSQPHASAMLDVESSSKGFLPPRMSMVQMNAITTPSEGLVVFCTDCADGKSLYIFDGTTWKGFVSFGSGTLNVEITNPGTMSGSYVVNQPFNATNTATLFYYKQLLNIDWAC